MNVSLFDIASLLSETNPNFEGEIPDPNDFSHTFSFSLSKFMKKYKSRTAAMKAMAEELSQQK